MKILIIGGAGFIGSHLAEALQKDGHEITVLNTYSERALANLSEIKNRLKLFWGDITDKDAVEKSAEGQEVIFHLASPINVDESLRDPFSFFNSGVSGTYNVLEAVKKRGSRLIYTSTREVYGDGHGLKEGEGLKENAEMRPCSPYAASKVASDRMCYSYYRSYGLDVTIVRPFNVYGERQKSGVFGALIPILTFKALAGEDLVIYGTGEAKRDYSHVSDLINGFQIILKNEGLKGKAINFASGEEIMIKDIAEYIAKKLQVRVTYGPPRPGEIYHAPADISFAKSLGFSPRVKIWEGIDRYIKWAKENISKK